MRRYYAAVKISAAELIKGERPEYGRKEPLLFERKKEADAYATKLEDQKARMHFSDYGPMDTSCVCAPSVTMIYTVEADISDEQKRAFGKTVPLIGQGVRVPFSDVGISHIEATVKATETSRTCVVDIDVPAGTAPDYRELDSVLRDAILSQQRLAQGIINESMDTKKTIVIFNRGEANTQADIMIQVGVKYAYASDSVFREEEPKTPQDAAFYRLALEISDKLNFTVAMHFPELYDTFNKSFESFPPETPLEWKLSAACKAVVGQIESSGWLAQTGKMREVFPQFCKGIDAIVQEIAEKFPDERPENGDGNGSIGDDDGDKGDGDLT